MTKTTLINYLKNDTKKRKYQKYICEICKENEKKKQHQNEVEYKKQRENNTLQFINLYLDKNHSWNKDLNFYERWNSIVHSYVDWDFISEYINNMDYKNFLETPYWKIIAEKKKREAGFRCQLCNSDKNLSTHHRTYKIRGKELQNLKELTVICDDCHKKHHNIN